MRKKVIWDSQNHVMSHACLATKREGECGKKVIWDSQNHVMSHACLAIARAGECEKSYLGQSKSCHVTLYQELDIIV